MSSTNSENRFPLRAIQVFQKAALLQNFTLAAEQLGVTQSAVSRKIAELEAFLECKLFTRNGPHIELTADGRKFADRVSYAFEELHRACNHARSQTTSATVTLSMLPSVAAKWFAPRLTRFAIRHPDIELRLSASREIVDLRRNGIDGAIRYGKGRWPNTEAMWLGSETIQPVCSPEMIEKYDLREPAALLAAPLLHSDIAEDWVSWFNAACVSLDHTLRGPEIADDSAMLQATISGQGVALGRSLLVKEDLASGRLVAPFDTVLEAQYSYWFVFFEPSKNLELVMSWVEEEFSSAG